MAALDTPIRNLSFIEKKYLKKLEQLGVKSVRDFLYFFPHRYDDFSKLSKIADLKPDQTATIEGKIIDIQNIRTWKRRMNITEALVQDKSGSARVVWFNQPYIVQNIKKDSLVRLSGKVNWDKKGLYFSSPAYEMAKRAPTNTGRIVPVYPETRGLTSRWLRWKISQLLKKYLEEIPEIIPNAILKRQNLVGAQVAIQELHFPSSFGKIKEAQKRMAFEEMFFIQLVSVRARKDWETSRATKINFDEKLVKDFVGSLPFKLTDAQRKSAFQILRDVEKPHPMNRLFEGDVGSGKTVVAAIAALEAMMAGYQTAIMAPTEVLARQHFETFGKVLKGFSQKVGLLTNSESRTFWKKNTRKNFLGKIRRGEIKILIGTHALIQESVEFKNLALVIIDEQHRFGVEQRARLQKAAAELKDNLKNSVPHLLSMTATPIPRTLALAFYGNLDLSILDELPKGRKKIITEIITPANRHRVYDFIRSEIKSGRQAFFIFPLIEESEKISGKAATEEHRNLSEKIFPELKIGLLHGRMKPKDKEEVMKDFKDKKYDILVSTSVIEVGVDVPNATIMVIEGSERFGLAQLHQFRGRVGRSEHQSHCFLFTDSPSAMTNKRLKALIESEDGFKLAEKDLEIRGPGQFIGKRQSGIADTAMQHLSDVKLIQQARIEAQSLFEFDPKLEKFPILKNTLEKFNKEIHLE
ncbi:MAG: ATP-dependent DNA helicase RecG [Candidatus Moranbacteria bacterium RBG_13_45_13]|nr:MAG: ATP-dependent DNA helicase RecG [Candidatus Moranbacteria bacterium RBG_13_45_13]